jgi:hypothetical protein
MSCRIVQLCCAATDSHGEVYMWCAELNRAKDWEWDEKCKQFVPRASALVLLKAKSAEALGTRLKPNVYNVPISYPEYARSQVGVLGIIHRHNILLTVITVNIPRCDDTDLSLWLDIVSMFSIMSQSRSPSLRSSGRNRRLWDNPLPEAKNPG